MKVFLKKAICCLLAWVLIFAVSVPYGAAAISYPQGVTSEKAEASIEKTDKLISGVVAALKNTDLKTLLMPQLCSGEVLSLLLVEAYRGLEENSESLSSLGIDLSVKNIAYYLSNYPNVSNALAQYSSWQQVSLEGVDWGVSDKVGFAYAVSAMFTPLNSILYALLCGGTYNIGILLGVKGDKGYENAIIPIYETLGHTSYVDKATFYSNAAADKSSMMRIIAYDVMCYAEKILDAPVAALTENLPSIAYFLNNGGLDKAISSLVEPLKVSLMSISIPIEINNFVDLSALEGGFTIDIDIQGLGALSGMRTAPLELERLAECGTLSGGRVEANKGDVYIEVLRWLLETLKLNEAMINQMLAGEGSSAELTSIVTRLMMKPTDDIIAILIDLLTSEQAVVNNHQWSFAANIYDAQVSYTPNLDRDDYIRALEEIDPLLDQIAAETGTVSSISQAILEKVYSGSLLSSAVIEIYSLLQSEELSGVVSLLGIALSPDEVALQLAGEPQLQTAAAQLSNISSWEYVNGDALDWGFENGDKQGFINAITALLRPADGILRMFLAGDKLTVLDAVDFYGSDGYNTAVIPLLEALGVSAQAIPSYSEYLTQIRDTDAIKPILTALCSLIDRIAEKPVYTITQIIPNLMYFLNKGSLAVCMQNLIYPVVVILERLGISDAIDFSSITDIDINSLINGLLVDMNIQFVLPELSLSQFEGMGTLERTPSKRTQNGQNIEIYAVSADQPAVLVTVLRYLIQIVQAPGNESFVQELLSGVGDNEIFATFSAGIGEDLAAMSVDEGVEWLYKIFFRERVVVEELPEQEYTPEIIYEKVDEKAIINTALIAAAVVLVLLCAVYVNRDRIRFAIEDRKEKKKEKEE